MTWEMWFVLGVVIAMLVALIREVTRPDIIVFTALFSFIITGILTVDEALKGFSNEGMLTIALLFIIASAIQRSGVFERLIKNILKEGQRPRVALLKLVFPSALLSGFLNNTPIVATFTPIIRSWCEQQKLSPSKFLMPLSFATILGGTMTLIGTSTNLVVHGLMLEEGLGGFSFFQLAIVGVPVAFIGLIYLGTIGYKLLPDRKAPTFQKQQTKEYLVEMSVGEHCPLIHKTIKEANLRQLKGLYLFEVIREKEKLSPVKSSMKIKEGDRLIFTGLISTIAELEKIKGLHLETGSELGLDTLKNGATKLVEVVVSHQSSLLKKRIKDSYFRSRFDAAVIAVHRNQERIHSKIGDIILKPGDTLLLLAGSDFNGRISETNDFYLATSVDDPFQLPSGWKSWLPSLTLIAMLILVVFEVITMFVAAAFGVIILILTKILSPQEAKQSIHFDVLLVIASAFGIGFAMQKTGLASTIANSLVSIVAPIGIIGILFAVYFLTTVFTEMVTNNAAAVIMFPIGMEVAYQVGANPVAFAVLIAIAASSSFLTPIGYQTNLIVYGPGGYRFKDYMKVGLPLNILMMIGTITITYLIWI
ncbi:SLC13 family permease [Alkalihalobacterium sp. APHAB7]|uniref:SLC13 family permease n=1 Tax=Alkalihalobacterium sp. APHAB7 TaxID=3402081 RepID=UPI003AADF066